MTQAELLRRHIQADNAKYEAKIKAEFGENALICNMVEDPEHWAKYGIHTPEDFDRYLIYSDISDVYKSAHGFRPRMDWKNMSMQELEDFLKNI